MQRPGIVQLSGAHANRICCQNTAIIELTGVKLQLALAQHLPADGRGIIHIQRQIAFTCQRTRISEIHAVQESVLPLHQASVVQLLAGNIEQPTT